MKRIVLICRNLSVPFRSISLLWMTLTLGAFAAQHSLATEPDRVTEGQELFYRQWVYDDYQDPFLRNVEVAPNDQEVGDGLGPLHNADSCVACHVSGGAAGVDRNVTMLTIDPRSSILKAERGIGQARRELLDFYPGVLTRNGNVSLDIVLHEASSRPGFEILRAHLRGLVPGGVPRAWYSPDRRSSQVLADRPVLAGRSGNIDFYLSQRNSPPLYGLGEIDSIPISALEKVAKQQHRSSRGKISGRVGPGKFGWRAQTDSLLNFVRAACAGELGLAQRGIQQAEDPVDLSYQNPGFDITEEQTLALADFVASLPAPSPSTSIPRNTQIRLGEQQFARLGCNACHPKNLDGVRHIYSDLLLHDMGERLQAPSPAPMGVSFDDAPRMVVRSLRPSGFSGSGSISVSSYYGTPPNRYPVPLQLAQPATPTFPRAEITEDIWNPTRPEDVTWDALQREWRTPPLWGLVDSGPYLHDGRAATIEEAILWHGGEAEESAAAFRRMAPKNRQRLMAFLQTLVAPVGLPAPDSLTTAVSHTSSF